MVKNQKKIGAMLIEDGIIEKDQLSIAINQQRSSNGKLGSIINQMGSADEESIAFELGKQLGLQYITLGDKTIPQEVINKVSPALAEKYCIIPVEFIHNTLTIAMTDPDDLKVLDEIAFTLGVEIKPVLALEHSIKKAQSRHYQDFAYSPPPIYKTSAGEKDDNMEILRFEHNKNNLSYPNKAIIEAITEILIEKNITTRADLFKKIRKKLKKYPE